MAGTGEDNKEADGADALEAHLEQAERRLQAERQRRAAEDHAEGLGPTLGQDLGRPNPGHAVEDDADDDPPA